MSQRYGRAGSFSNVDASSDTREFVSYLDDVTRLVGDAKRAGYAALQLQPGMHVLDVGCGTGEDVRALAEIVAPGGSVTGVDFSQTMIDEANARGVPPNASFRQASAGALPFDAEAFDAVRSERVFQHLEDPDAAACELYRVLKPGGVAMLIDQDWETLTVAGSAKNLTRTICNAFVDHAPNGWAGRNHRGVLTRAGFHDVNVLPFPYMLPYPAAMSLILAPAVQYALKHKAISAHDAAEWTADLQMAEERGEFLCAFMLFAAVARR